MYLRIALVQHVEPEGLSIRLRAPQVTEVLHQHKRRFEDQFYQLQRLELKPRLV